MSLRAKILILVIGALVMPIAVTVISFRLTADVESLRNLKDSYTAYRAWKQELSDSTIDIAQIDALLSETPESAEIRIFSDDGDTIYSRTVGNLFAEERKFLFVDTIPVNFASGGSGYLALTRPPGPMNHNEDRWYVPLTGLVFVAVMVIIIAQSMNRSISSLEKATRRIADGDLDFELPIKGNDKLASLTRSFDSMRAHLKEEYARRSRFIMGISHDLKTPLSSISGYATAIGEGYADTPEKLDRYIKIIEDKTKLLESRISVLIEYVRRETTDWKLSLRDVELKPFFDELGRVFESEAHLKNRLFRAEIRMPPGAVAAMDEDMVVRAMENLMQNALAYSHEGDEVALRCVIEGDRGVVSLANGGHGISSEDLPHIFDPFFRGSKDRRGAGFGLGLSTVESVISSHGWSIEAKSDPEGDTVFTISLPVTGSSEA